MRAMMAVVVAMGVLIVAGVVTIAITITRRMAAPVLSTAVVLDEPNGSRIATLSVAGDRLAVLLQGGGPDRVILLDPRTGMITGRLGLAR